MRTNGTNSNYKTKTDNLPRTLATRFKFFFQIPYYFFISNIKVYVFLRKGALILFSEEITCKSGKNSKERETDNLFGDNSTLSLNQLPIKTVNDLQKNVLFYGLDETEVSHISLTHVFLINFIKFHIFTNLAIFGFQ